VTAVRFVLLAGLDADSLDVLGTFKSSTDAQAALAAYRRRYGLFVVQELRLPATAYDSAVGRAVQFVGRLP
jgi:hypothetical protein